MPMERWGTLSVKDHLDSQALIADLLLYDKLVFPVFSGEGERTRWRDANWNPDEQESLIEDLGTDVTVRADWNEHARQSYDDLRKARRQLAFEPYQATRMLLATDPTIVSRDTEVRVIAAYHDEDEGRKDLGLTTAKPDEDALGKLAFVVGQQFLVPLIDQRANPRELMLRARDLSLDHAYRKRRQTFYEWQEGTVDAIVRGRETVKSATDDLKREVDLLNHPIRQYFSERGTPVALKAVLTVVGIALPYALHLHEAVGLIGLVPGAFEIVKFGAEQVIEPVAQNKCEAAAIFVSARRALG